MFFCCALDVYACSCFLGSCVCVRMCDAACMPGAVAASGGTGDPASGAVARAAWRGFLGVLWRCPASMCQESPARERHCRDTAAAPSRDAQTLV